MIPSEVLKKVRQIEIRTRSAVNSVLSGAYSSSFKGRGMEFSEVREYVLSEPYAAVFPPTKLRKGSKAKDYMVTVQGGHVAFVGRGSSAPLIAST